MSETLEQFIVRRRGELDEESSKLQAQLRVIDAEREKVDKVAMMFAAEPAPEPSEALARAFIGLPSVAHTRSPKRVSEATIKEMVLQILDLEREGVTALDILAKITNRTGIEYPRTSLSPQLSRLKAEGKIHREGRLWLLGDGPDTASDLDDLLGSSRSDDADADEAPTEVEAS